MSGLISVRDPEFENYIWMNPLGKHFGLMTAGDMICLDLNTGAIVGGNKVSISLFTPFATPAMTNLLLLVRWR
jgi:ribulose-5-phosphate 4-epimerase/fuculose-1-phosphate aldolase